MPGDESLEFDPAVQIDTASPVSIATASSDQPVSADADSQVMFSLATMETNV